jgi:hypothetical protein
MGLLYLLLIVDALLRIMEGMLFLRLWMAEDILPIQETVCSTDQMCRIFIFIYLFILSFIYLSLMDHKAQQSMKYQLEACLLESDAV